MSNMEIWLPVVIIGGLGLIFGALLGVASKVFYVPVDERVPQIENLLPGANCGGCGFAGCSALAKAIVEGKADVNACAVASAENKAKIAEIVGADVQIGEKMVAKVMCAGTDSCAGKKYRYDGIQDCISVSKLQGGDKLCAYGCLGYGTCVDVCSFGGVEIKDGVAVVNSKLCEGCGSCVNVCPRGVIKLVPASATVNVLCTSKDKGIITKDLCTAGCIGCMLCVKNCEAGAISVVDNHAVIDYDKCTRCGVCVDKCPKKIIRV